jgi:hypothetical protein
VAGSFKYGNEPLGFVKDGEFLHRLSDYQIHEKDYV